MGRKKEEVQKIVGETNENKKDKRKRNMNHKKKLRGGLKNGIRNDKFQHTRNCVLFKGVRDNSGNWFGGSFNTINNFNHFSCSIQEAKT